MRVTTHGKIADKHRKRTLSVCVAVTSLSHDDFSDFANSVCIHNTQITARGRVSVVSALRVSHVRVLIILFENVR